MWQNKLFQAAQLFLRFIDDGPMNYDQVVIFLTVTLACIFYQRSNLEPEAPQFDVLTTWRTPPGIQILSVRHTKEDQLILNETLHKNHLENDEGIENSRNLSEITAEHLENDEGIKNSRNLSEITAEHLENDERIENSRNLSEINAEHLENDEGIENSRNLSEITAAPLKKNDLKTTAIPPENAFKLPQLESLKKDSKLSQETGVNDAQVDTLKTASIDGTDKTLDFHKKVDFSNRRHSSLPIATPPHSKILEHIHHPTVPKPSNFHEFMQKKNLDTSTRLTKLESSETNPQLKPLLNIGTNSKNTLLKKNDSETKVSESDNELDDDLIFPMDPFN